MRRIQKRSPGRMTIDNRATVCSIFTGAGGLDVGLELAGFRTIAAVECDEDCVSTLRGNQAATIFRGPGSRRPRKGSVRHRLPMVGSPTPDRHVGEPKFWDRGSPSRNRRPRRNSACGLAIRPPGLFATPGRVSPPNSIFPLDDPAYS